MIPYHEFIFMIHSFNRTNIPCPRSKLDLIWDCVPSKFDHLEISSPTVLPDSYFPNISLLFFLLHMGSSSDSRNSSSFPACRSTISAINYRVRLPRYVSSTEYLIFLMAIIIVCADKFNNTIVVCSYLPVYIAGVV